MKKVKLLALINLLSTLLFPIFLVSFSPCYLNGKFFPSIRLLEPAPAYCSSTNILSALLLVSSVTLILTSLAQSFILFRRKETL